MWVKVAVAGAFVSLVVAGAAGAAPTAASLGSPGVVQWRFQVSGQYVLSRPAVGPDGGVVVASSTGDVYSLTAAGALRWVVRSAGDGGGPSIGADGTVYVASMNTITAIAADGSIRWRFTEPSVGQGMIAGPTVGPDGNIYAVSDYGGLGAFALSPAGQLLWSNSGNPTFSEYGQDGAEIVFGSGRLYAAFDEVAVAPSTIFGLTLGGAQQWSRPLGGSDDMFMQFQRQPATGSDGSLYLTAMGGANGWSLYRVDPGSGAVLWGRSPWPSNGMSPPTVGPDGSVYFSRSLSYLDSVTSSGQPRWTFFDGSLIDHPAVSPDGSIVVAGVRPNFGEPGSVRAWNAATGTVAWQVDLPNENGGYQVLETQPRFSADSKTAYFGTGILAGGLEYSFVYAVSAGTAASPPPPSTTRCVVPGVVGTTLDAARAQIIGAGCSVGSVKRVRSKQIGIVLAQSPAPGTVLPQGGAVDLTVGRK
jgi:putative pyrroloquinoline-quinone binding quinoprotein/PASTA domain-containing protein